ncbi:sterile alpha motif domain-containing 3-like isoform X3, partial [Clarias magur]
ISSEFLTITTGPLLARFLVSLDKQHYKLIEIIRNKGGIVREKTREIIFIFKFMI